MTPEEVERYLDTLGRLYVQGATALEQPEYLIQFGGILSLAARERPWLRRGARTLWGHGRVDEDVLRRRARARWAAHRRRIKQRIVRGTHPVRAVAEQLHAHGVETFHTPDQARELAREQDYIDATGAYRVPIWRSDSEAARRHVAARLSQLDVLTQDPIAASVATGYVVGRTTFDDDDERRERGLAPSTLDDIPEDYWDDGIRLGEATSAALNILAPAAEGRAARRGRIPGQVSGPVSRDPANQPRPAVVQDQRGVGGRARATGGGPRPTTDPARSRGRTRTRPSSEAPTAARPSRSTAASGPARSAPSEGGARAAAERTARDRGWAAQAQRAESGRARVRGTADRGTTGRTAEEPARPAARASSGGTRAAEPGRSGGRAARGSGTPPEDDVPLGRPVELEDLMMGAMALRDGGGPARARVSTLQRMRQRLGALSEGARQLYRRVSDVDSLADLVDFTNARARRIIQRFGRPERMNPNQRRGFLNGILGRIAEHLFHRQFQGAGRATAEQLVRQLRIPRHHRTRILYATRAWTRRGGRRAEITDGLYLLEITEPAVGNRAPRRRVVLLCAGESKSSVSALLDSFRTTQRRGRRHDPQQVRVAERLNRDGLIVDLPGPITRRSPSGAVGAERLQFGPDQVSVHRNFTVFVGTPRSGGQPSRRRQVLDARRRLRGQGVRVEPLRLHNTEQDVSELAEALLEAAIETAQSPTASGSGAATP